MHPALMVLIGIAVGYLAHGMIASLLSNVGL